MWRAVVGVLLLAGISVAKPNAESAGGGLNPYACGYDELRGKWVFEVGQGGYDKTINCAKTGTIVRRYQIFLDTPDIARDEFGNVGFWTMVDALGIEVVVHGKKFFAFVKFKDAKKTRFCNETILGSSHDVLGRDWACFFGRKVASSNSLRSDVQEVLQREERSAEKTATRKELQSRMYRTELDMVDAINAAQSSWTATHYKEYDSMSVDELLSKAGSRLKMKNPLMTPAPITEEQKRLVAALPASFDWRNVNGINYVSPVRDQGKCGSCYAFTSAAMNEARLAIFSNRTIQVVFSVQDVVDCSYYSLGCDGGSAYAIAGKYGEDYGMVEESCNPYAGVEGNSCGTKSSCKRYYFTGYEYVGGYYGACNEAQMMLSLVNNGPLAIAIKVNEDLMFYKSGIYSPTGISSRGNDFVQVDHAVTLVGYGSDSSHGKYWIMKNSWGPTWGDRGGYFKLSRGSNVCEVESDAMETFPIF